MYARVSWALDVGPLVVHKLWPYIVLAWRWRAGPACVIGTRCLLFGNWSGLAQSGSARTGPKNELTLLTALLDCH